MIEKQIKPQLNIIHYKKELKKNPNDMAAEKLLARSRAEKRD